MNKLKLLVIAVPFIITMIISSCSSAEKPSVVIKQDAMTEILTDLYIADGLLHVPNIRFKFENIDSTENYMRVIEKHGFQMNEFEENINYYFKNEPRKYEEIYDDVLANLSELEAINNEQSGMKKSVPQNLWIGKSSYRMPDDGTANPVEFSILTGGPGLYTIKARLTLFEDDQSIDPKATIYFWYDDGTEDGYMDLWDSKVYEKSQKSQSLLFEKELVDTMITHIKGRLIDYTPQAGHWEMHSSISGINVSIKAKVKTLPQDPVNDRR